MGKDSGSFVFEPKIKEPYAVPNGTGLIPDNILPIFSPYGTKKIKGKFKFMFTKDKTPVKLK